MRTATALLGLILLACAGTDGGNQSVSKPARSQETGEMVIVGQVTNEGVECPAVRGEDGTLYTIATSERQKLQPGVRVRITGTIAEMSMCMQGTTISATRVEVLQAVR